MDQALNPDLLAGALDRTANLPTPEELQEMLADAEVAAFFRSGQDVGPQLLETAWNLHHVGTARTQLAHLRAHPAGPGERRCYTYL